MAASEVCQNHSETQPGRGSSLRPLEPQPTSPGPGGTQLSQSPEDTHTLRSHSPCGGNFRAPCAPIWGSAAASLQVLPWCWRAGRHLVAWASICDISKMTSSTQDYDLVLMTQRHPTVGGRLGAGRSPQEKVCRWGRVGTGGARAPRGTEARTRPGGVVSGGGREGEEGWRRAEGGAGSRRPWGRTWQWKGELAPARLEAGKGDPPPPLSVCRETEPVFK